MKQPTKLECYHYKFRGLISDLEKEWRKKKESEEGERERRNKGTKNEVKEKGKRKIEDGK